MKRSTKAVSFAVLAIFITGFVLLRVLAKAEAPIQPIEYDHWQHVTSKDGPELECTFCHEYADKGPHATIPNTSTCMSCHEVMKTESPEVQKLAELHNSGKQPAWVRIYFFEPSANAYFNHKPHVKAGIECATCHGQVGQMRRVRREVQQTMGWCIDCHRERGVSNDCYICHR
jgi:hypothetical protein